MAEELPRRLAFGRTVSLAEAEGLLVAVGDGVERLPGVERDLADELKLAGRVLRTVEDGDEGAVQRINNDAGVDDCAAELDELLRDHHAGQDAERGGNGLCTAGRERHPAAGCLGPSRHVSDAGRADAHLLAKALNLGLRQVRGLGDVPQRFFLGIRRAGLRIRDLKLAELGLEQPRQAAQLPRSTQGSRTPFRSASKRSKACSDRA